jgi:hypothetical protein
MHEIKKEQEQLIVHNVRSSRGQVRCYDNYTLYWAPYIAAPI